MTNLPASKHKFGSVEQLDQMLGEMDWPLEYRQLERGSFVSTFMDLKGDAWFLMEEESSRKVEILGGAPQGMYMLALTDGGSGMVNGQCINSDSVFVQAPDADLNAMLPAGMKVIQVGVSYAMFEELVADIAPDIRVPLKGAHCVPAVPGSLQNIRLAMKTAIANPVARNELQEEVVSQVLADIITVMPLREQRVSAGGSRGLDTRRVFAKARAYIESHLDTKIEIQAVCRYAETNIRMLQRIFLRETGVSPQQYVKARRLNAVRRRLLLSEVEQGLTVTQLASDYGFTHMGRFSQEYARYFGETPRQTLRGH